MNSNQLSAHLNANAQHKKLFFHREKLYNLSWDVKMPQNTLHPIVCAIFSGFFAEVLVWKFPDDKSGYQIKIYSGSGRLISGFFWKTSLKLLAYDWIRTDTLIFVFENGSIFSYGCERRQVPLKIIKLSHSLLNMVCFWSKGFVAAIGSGSLIKVTCLFNNIKFEEIFLDTQHVQCLAVKESFKNLEAEEDIYVATESELSYYNCGRRVNRMSGPMIVNMRLSYQKNLLAIYYKNGILSVVDGGLKKVLFQVNLKITDPPLQMAWVASAVIVLRWSKKSMLIGKECNILEERGICFISQEFDGLRMISKSYHELLRPLQQFCDYQLCAFNSSSLSSPLCDLLKSPQFETNVSFSTKEKKVLAGLLAIINNYVVVAQFVFNQNLQLINIQKAVLSSVLLCQGQFSVVKSEIKRCCSFVRTLNYLRHVSIGMPFTAIQYRTICKEVLIKRLFTTGNHPVAMRLFKKNMSLRNQILMKWISFPFAKEKTYLVSLFRMNTVFPNIPWCDFTTHSKIHKKKKIQIIQYDPRAQMKVDTFLLEGYFNEAMDLAASSKDTNIQYFAIFKLILNQAESNIENSLGNLNILYYRYSLKGLLSRSWKHKFREKNSKSEFQEYFATIFKSITKQYAIVGGKSNFNFVHSLKDQNFEILLHQLEFFDDINVRMSLRQMLFFLTGTGKEYSIKKLCEKYNFSEQHYIYLKVKSLCKNSSWTSLTEFTCRKHINIEFLLVLLTKYKAPENQLMAYKTQKKLTNTNKIIEGTLIEAQRAAAMLSESRQNLAYKATEYIKAFNSYSN